MQKVLNARSIRLLFRLDVIQEAFPLALTVELSEMVLPNRVRREVSMLDVDLTVGGRRRWGPLQLDALWDEVLACNRDRIVTHPLVVWYQLLKRHL